MGDEARFDDRFRRRLPRIIAASAVMGGALWGGALLLGPWLGMDGLRWIALALLVGIGIASYGAAVLIFRAFRIADLKAALRRQR